MLGLRGEPLREAPMTSRRFPAPWQVEQTLPQEETRSGAPKRKEQEYRNVKEITYRTGHSIRTVF
jgi:hypothetical protein